MNLKSNPTAQQLKQLLANCDDKKDRHLIWVDKNWNVKIESFSGNESSTEWKKNNRHHALAFGTEVWQPGNGYVGTDAANDTEYVDKRLQELIAFSNGEYQPLLESD